jgi:hypothetical protein
VVGVALAVAGVAAVLTATRGANGAAGEPGNPLSDTRWRVVAVTHHQMRTAITSGRVVVDFRADGEFGASDGVNDSSGHWAAAADALRITHVATTLVGYGGTDPAVLAAMRGIGALTSQSDPVVAQLARRAGHDDRLRLIAGTVVLDLVRDGRPPPTGRTGAAPSSTASTIAARPHSYVNGSEIAPGPS